MRDWLCGKCGRIFEDCSVRDGHEKLCVFDWAETTSEVPFVAFAVQEREQLVAQFPPGSFVGTNLRGTCCFFEFNPNLPKAAEFIRYHGTCLEATLDALAEPFSFRLAVGHSMTKSKPGIYFSASLPGAFQYCYGSKAQTGALLTLRAPWGLQVGMKNSDRNKVSGKPLDCVIVAACVFKTSTRFCNQTPVAGEMHPIMKLDPNKAGFPADYVAYCLKRCRCSPTGCNMDGSHKDEALEVEEPAGSQLPQLGLSARSEQLLMDLVGHSIVLPTAAERENELPPLPRRRPEKSLAELWEESGAGEAGEDVPASYPVYQASDLTPRLRNMFSWAVQTNSAIRPDSA